MAWLPAWIGDELGRICAQSSNEAVRELGRELDTRGCSSTDELVAAASRVVTGRPAVRSKLEAVAREVREFKRAMREGPRK